MQLLLPIFPPEVRLINSVLGVFASDEIVNYLHAGAPIYSHAETDVRHFRYITSKFILEGLCTRREISDCFGVSYESVKRYTQRLRTRGYQSFFEEDERQGSCYKLLPAVITRMQENLEAGKTNSEIARIEHVTEGAVRYALKTGKLQKKKMNHR